MDLFTYLLGKKGKNSLAHKGDLFAYLLGSKNQGEIKEATGTEINITDVTREKIESLLMTKESTQEGTPTPDNPVEIKTVKGYRNLFDKNNSIILNTYVGQSSHVISTNAGGNFRTIAIPCKPNTQYFIKKFLGSTVLITGTSADIPTYGTELNQYSLINGQTKYSFETNSTANYLIAQICTNSDINLGYTPQQILDSFQITEGTEELPYVPYGTNWIYIKVSNGTDTNYYTIPLNDNEIVGIGDYKDELIVDKNGKCWLNKKTARKQLISTGNITNPSSSLFIYYNSTQSINNYFVGGFCNFFNFKNDERIIDNATALRYLNDNEMAFRLIGTKDRTYIKSNNFNSLNDFKSFLDNNQVILYYVLETPELIDLNYDLDVRLFNGVNNISNSDDMDMTLKYY